MKYVIDGFNYTAYVTGRKRIEASLLKEIIKKIAIWAQQECHSVVMIFDGGFASYKERMSIGTVEIIYAGYRHSADDAIIEEIDRFNKHGTVLITADRLLAQAVKQKGFFSMSPAQFAKQMKLATELTRHAAIKSNSLNANNHKRGSTLFKYETYECDAETDELMKKIETMNLAELSDDSEK